MQEEKQWYLSKTILASIVTVIALVAGMFNIVIDTEVQGSIVELVSVAIGLVGSVVAIWARIKASKTIK